MRRRQVFVSGTWDDERAEPYAEPARTVGRLIAEAGCDLACGPGTGIAGHVMDGFRSVPDRAGLIRWYMPTIKAMKAAGESPRGKADEMVLTGLDYPMRNVLQIRRSHGLIAVTGGDGTLGEIVPALSDYRLPVAVLAGSGPAAGALPGLLDWFPDWRPLVLLGDSADELVRFVLERLSG